MTTPLHIVGDFLRNAFAAIPMIGARLLFVSLLAILLFWVLTLPKEAVTREGSGGRPAENLRWWAALALLIQLIIYVWV